MEPNTLFRLRRPGKLPVDQCVPGLSLWRPPPEAGMSPRIVGAPRPCRVEQFPAGRTGVPAPTLGVKPLQQMDKDLVVAGHVLRVFAERQIARHELRMHMGECFVKAALDGLFQLGAEKIFPQYPVILRVVSPLIQGDDVPFFARRLFLRRFSRAFSCASIIRCINSGHTKGATSSISAPPG